MKGKVFPILFALPFFGIGMWMAYSVGSNVMDALRMRTWQRTEARLSAAGYKTHSDNGSATLPFLIYEEVIEKENHPALIALLFPLIGIGLFVWAVRRTREWNRFGPSPVTLDPFPGAIGGHVGGTIDVRPV